VVSIGGAITDVRAVTTKNGQKMAFVRIEDQSGDIEAVLFPNSFQQTASLWQRDRVVVVRGKVNARGRNGQPASEVKIMVDEAREITPDQAARYQPTGKAEPHPPAGPDKRVYVRITNTADQQMLLSLKKTIDSHQGGTEVVLVLGEATSKQAIKLPGGIDRDSEGLSKLQSLVGADNLVIK